MPSNTFDEILGLEEQFYDDGYQQGLSDGLQVGKIEGRTFGLEKGFEKYVESGRLYGKSLVWANRTPHFQKNSNSVNQSNEPTTVGASSESPCTTTNPPRKLPALSDNVRLSKNIKALHALAESESLSTENTEEAVSDFDDRYKRAQAKSKIIERMAGETNGGLNGPGKSSGDGSIEDVSVLNARH